MSFKYRELAETIELQVRSGQYSAGAALPALRQFAAQHDVSLSTACKSYEYLEQQGVIESRPKKGFFVRIQNQLPAPEIDEPPMLATEDHTALTLDVHRNAMRSDLINLGKGNLSPEFLPVEELQRSLTRAARRNPKAAYSYGHPRGEPSLRQALSELMAGYNCPLKPNQFLVTNGCLEAVTLVTYEHTNPNDIVGIISPCYSGLLMMLKSTGRQILEIPCGAKGPDLDEIEYLMARKLIKALILSATAHNPVGFSLSVQDKRRLAKMAKQYQTPLIEDDTMGDIVFPGVESSPIFSYDDSGYVYYCNAFSKALAAGFRIGWIAANKSLDSIEQKKLSLNLTCSLPAQLGLADYLFSEGYHAHIKRLQERIQQEMNILLACVNEHFPATCKVSQPTGGIFCWIETSDSNDIESLYTNMLKEKIFFSPGKIFSMTNLYNKYLRLTVGNTTDKKRMDAIAKLGSMIKA